MGQIAARGIASMALVRKAQLQTRLADELSVRQLEYRTPLVRKDGNGESNGF